jgi:CrcB protein
MAGKRCRRRYGAEARVKAALINSALVGSGGFVGALLRYGLSGLVHRQVPFTTFPYGTMAVNLLGCLLIGVFAGLAESRQLFGPELRTFVLIGLLGGFTTFSTLGYETFAMIRDGEYLLATVNVGVQVVLGLALVWAGYMLTAIEVGWR